MEQLFRSNEGADEAPESVLIAGGTVVDGTGAEPYRADVLVAGGRVAAVGADLPDARPASVLPAEGRLVAPGFVDLHTHSDLAVLLEPAAENRLRQGITTDVVGNCGFSAVPADPRRRRLFEDLLAAVGPVAPVTWSDLRGYEARLQEAAPAINVGVLVGHGALRAAVAGLDDRPLSRDELARMERALADLLDEGALGLSTGLTYVPSMFAPPAEIHALARVVRERDALYASHARSGAGRVRLAIEETIDVAAQTGARVQHSHIAINEPAAWGSSHALLELFERAVEDGLDVGFDVYPYAASASALTQYLPAWLSVDGREGLSRALADPGTRQRAQAELARGWYGGIPWLWDRVTVAASPSRPEAVGRTIRDLADERSQPPEAVVLDLCASDGPSVHVVLAYRDERDVAAFVAHPLGLLASDGLVQPPASDRERPHPRSFGAQIRFLTRYAGPGRALRLPEAIRRLTSAPADRAGLGDRGRLLPGMAADVVVIDLDALEDRATFEDPFVPPAGVEHVLVNGVPTLVAGASTGRRAGRLLRRSPSPLSTQGASVG